jgi:hypothetical protein
LNARWQQKFAGAPMADQADRLDFAAGLRRRRGGLYTLPPLTTIRSPMTSLATKTARLLPYPLHGTPDNIDIMPSELMIRQSV